MKRTFYALACLLMCTLTIQAQTQYPVNGGFEDWTMGDFSGFTYDSLIQWDTPQRLAVALSVPDTVTYRETVNVNSGTSACRLITKFVSIGGGALETNVPGSLATGSFFVDIFAAEFGVVGGQPMDCTPTEFSLYYQYAPVNDDTAQVQFLLTNAADTLADTLVTLPDPVSTYTQLTVPIHYKVTGVQPDMHQVIILSSGVGGQVGSTMWVDDVKFSGGDCFTGIFDPSQPLTLMDVAPNPANLGLMIEYPGKQNVPMVVYDVTGIEHMRQEAIPGTNVLDISNLPAGSYFVRINDNEGMTYSARFEKQ